MGWSVTPSRVPSSPSCLACFCVGGHGIFSPRYPEAPSVISETSTVVSANLLHGFGQFNLRKPRRREREVGCQRWKAFKHPPHAADRHNRIAHQAQRSQILTSSPLSAVSLYGSHSFLRCCHTVRELSLVLQNKTSKSVEKVRGYNTGIEWKIKVRSSVAERYDSFKQAVSVSCGCSPPMGATP